MRATLLLVVSMLHGISALSLSPSGKKPGNTLGATRRSILSFGAVAGSAAALLGADRASAVSARTGLSSVFTGEYDDPNHPGCLRSIKVVGGKEGPDGRRRGPTAVVKGVDDNCKAPELKDVWSLSGSISKSEDGDDTIFIDFSPKGTHGTSAYVLRTCCLETRVSHRTGGPKNLKGTFDTFGSIPGITFPDGNKWTKVHGPVRPTARHMY
jgi:hypothetical protein